MKVLDNNGLKYAQEGSGKTILFFHGWGGSPVSYESIIKILASEYKIIAPFFTSFKHYKESEREISAILAKEKEIIVVGHSAGGICALNFSADYPEKTKALVLVDSLGAGKNAPLKITKLSWLKHVIILLLHPKKYYPILIKDFLKQLFSKNYFLEDSDYILTYQNKQFKPKFPVFLLWGRQDNLIPLKYGHDLEKLIHGVRMEIVEGDHYWLIGNPSLFKEKLNNFVK